MPYTTGRLGADHMSYADRINDSIVNAAEEQLAEMAQLEAEQCHPRFREWLADSEDGYTLAMLVSAALVVEARGQRDPVAVEDLGVACERIRNDYRQYRVATGDELPELIAEIENDAREARECR